MTAFIATYDLRETNPGPHSEFLEQADKNGWSPWLLIDGEWHRLPNTTLIGDFTDKPAAVAALKKTRADTEREMGRKVTMEKWIVAPRGDISIVSNDRQPAK